MQDLIFVLKNIQNSANKNSDSLVLFLVILTSINFQIFKHQNLVFKVIYSKKKKMPLHHIRRDYQGSCGVIWRKWFYLIRREWCNYGLIHKRWWGGGWWFPVFPRYITTGEPEESPWLLLTAARSYLSSRPDSLQRHARSDGPTRHCIWRISAWLASLCTWVQ